MQKSIGRQKLRGIRDHCGPDKKGKSGWGPSASQNSKIRAAKLEEKARERAGQCELRTEAGAGVPELARLTTSRRTDRLIRPSQWADPRSVLDGKAMDIRVPSFGRFP
jgi:hypothetical protein